MTEIETIKAFYDAINRNRSQDAIPLMTDDVVREEPTGHDTAGIYHGPQAVAEHITKGRSTWVDGTCTPTRFLTKGNRIIAYVHVDVQVKGQATRIDGRTADAFTFRDGKIAGFRTFWEDHQAEAWLAAQD